MSRYLDAEYKAEWIAALRSGKYQQCHCQLMDSWVGCPEPKFCAIGVFFVAVLGARVVPSSAAFGVHLQFEDNILTETRAGSILKRVGVLESEVDYIVRKNDDNRLSFSEIADWIELNL